MPALPFSHGRIEMFNRSQWFTWLILAQRGLIIQPKAQGLLIATEMGKIGRHDHRTVLAGLAILDDRDLGQALNRFLKGTQRSHNAND